MISGSVLFWILGPFFLLATISSWLGIYHHESRNYHPAEPGWTYDQCLRDLRAPIYDRDPDMLELPEDLEIQVRRKCTDHAWEHVRP